MKLAVLLVALAALLGATPTPTPSPARPQAPVRPVPAAGAAAVQPVTIVIVYRVDAVTRIARLGSELAIGPGRLVAEIDLVNGTITGDLTLPVADGYFVVFGFVPTTAKTHMTPIGKVTGTIAAGDIRAHSEIDLRLDDVAVNAQPLGVGPACRAAQPLSLDVSGPFDLMATVLKGTYDIPAFGGCQDRERLDPLMTGLVSGPGNTIELTLTALPEGS
ncbi:hypothetical protein [Saccharothrix syringae]|uniref:DUF2993 domain-containing protein n=1 Tax=Saccharothrix syringae TaxID=103733 RepID=A0A5Q0H6J4_SACSY|nr:hypothetical protein [Saccharothrix syringae]QFZ21846.1 hypothetical protein EKG83_34540 [Saccharothrix syringae]